MPIPMIIEVLRGGPAKFLRLTPLLRVLPWLSAVVALKYYFGGARNRAERLLHGKVVMVTVGCASANSSSYTAKAAFQGGTSGIGAAVVLGLAQRGAQVVLLTQQPPSDPFIADYVEDLRSETANELIYAEQVDLSSLHSVRAFATRWIDNTPPRRLDMVLLCASTLTPRFGPPTVTRDGLEPCWGINFLANFQLLSILSPAIRAQPPDRDVRIVIATCSSYANGRLQAMQDSKNPLPAGRELATSKLALMVFARAFQKQLDAYQRPDKQANNARVIMVEPGYTRTPGMRRWLSMGSLWGLLAYLLLWPLLWLVLKSPQQGAQAFLTAAMEADFGQGAGGRLLRECREVESARKEVGDDGVAEELWKFTERQITALEKEGAVRRARERKAQDKTEPERDGEVKGPVNERTVTTSRADQQTGMRQR